MKRKVTETKEKGSQTLPRDLEQLPALSLAPCPSPTTEMLGLSAQQNHFTTRHSKAHRHHVSYPLFLGCPPPLLQGPPRPEFWVKRARDWSI